MEVINIFYPESKVYFDGSHYIAIPHTTNPNPRRPKVPEELVTVVEDNEVEESTENNGAEIEESECEVESKVEEKAPKRKATRSELFDQYWMEAMDLPKIKRRAFLYNKMRCYFKNEDALYRFIEEKIAAKTRNIIARKTRFIRKANNNEFNYFGTFTYDDKLQTEESFKKKLSMCFSHLQKRKGWKYMGVWERGGKTQRLHFHGIFWIPEGTMPGELFERRDYDFHTHRRKVTIQNTYFNSKFGRTDLEEICQHPMVYGRVLAYILKYIEKTGEKIVYSHGLGMYVLADIDENDVIMKYGLEDKKLLLYDDFVCYDEGEDLGRMSKETKRLMRRTN